MTEPFTSLMFSSAALLCSALASVHDVRARRIPNRLTGSAAAVALGMHFFMGGWSSVASAALAGLLAGGITVIFFLAGGMGAGDVKLLAAVGCFVGLAPLGSVLLTTAVFGALFGIVLAIRHGKVRQTIANTFHLLGHHRSHGFEPHAEIHMNAVGAVRMPFAIPVALACLVMLCVQVRGTL